MLRCRWIERMRTGTIRALNFETLEGDDDGILRAT